MSRFESLLVSDLFLDKKNPRIQAALEFYDPNDIDEIKMGMALGANAAQYEGDGTTYMSLKESIKTNGGIINPIIVNQTPDNKYYVVEGNTRVHIYRELKKSQVPGNWDYIPAIIYENMENENIDSIRLQAHLVGPRAWDAYSKAKYLWRLSTVENMPMERIVDYCGGKKNEIRLYIAGYELMEEYYRPLIQTDSDFDKTRFSAFLEVQKSNIPNLLVQNGFSFDDFAKWIYDEKFERLENVRNLPRILTNPRAKETFLKRGAKAAMIELTSITSPVMDVSRLPFPNLVIEAVKKIRGLPFDEVTSYKKNKEIIDLLTDLTDELAELLRTIDIEE